MKKKTVLLHSKYKEIIIDFYSLKIRCVSRNKFRTKNMDSLFGNTKLEYIEFFENAEELPHLSELFNPSPEPVTTDIALKEYLQNDFPTSPRGPPDRSCFAGKYNFAVEVNSRDVHKKTFLYSHRLSRIYVDMKCDFSIQFNWDHEQAPEMYVRAMVVFSDDSQAQKRVEKCVQHFQENSSAGLAKHIAKNVLHSSRELSAEGVYYCGDASLADSWYSVLVRFRRASPQPCAHAFKFTCKNSCTTGINRRAIAIIFTLEDEFGQVHGRQKIGTRVCACPRRDMLKDEESEGVYKSGKKRVPSNQIEPPPKTKKIKVEKLEDSLTLPPLPVIDTRTMVAGLEVMRHMMQQGAEHHTSEPQALKKYTDCIAAFDNALKTLKNTDPPPE